MRVKKSNTGDFIIRVDNIVNYWKFETLKELCTSFDVKDLGLKLPKRGKEKQGASLRYCQRKKKQGVGQQLANMDIICCATNDKIPFFEWRGRLLSRYRPKGRQPT